MRGIEPRAFHMQSERSTTELHPRRFQSSFAEPNFQLSSSDTMIFLRMVEKIQFKNFQKPFSIRNTLSSQYQI